MLTMEAEDALSRRCAAKAELDRLKTLIAACDVEIMNALEADETEFMRWVREIRGEIHDHEQRKLVWVNPITGDKYTVSKRKGASPRKSVSPEKLLSLGVPAHVIQMATTYGEPGKPGVSIRKTLGDKFDEGEE